MHRFFMLFIRFARATVLTLAQDSTWPISHQKTARTRWWYVRPALDSDDFRVFLRKQKLTGFEQYWWFCYLFYILTMICSKLSFAWFLLRITTAKIHSWIIYGASMVTVLAGIAFFFVTLFQCRPISYYWDKSQSGKCFEMGAVMVVAYLYSAFSVITDFTFAALPGFVIWSLHMAKRTKIALIILIAMGCMWVIPLHELSSTLVLTCTYSACSAIIVRLAYLSTLRDPDFLCEYFFPW